MRKMMKYEIPDLLALRSKAAIDIGKFTVHAIESESALDCL